MHARSALFDLYGDHLRARDDRAPVAALVRLLAPLGIAPPAVRTAISRMVRQGWLDPVLLPAGRGYALTQVRNTSLRIGRGTNAELRSENPTAGARRREHAGAAGAVNDLRSGIATVAVPVHPGS